MTLARLRDFVAVSGVPGCDVLCARRGGFLRKTAWVIVLSSLLSLTLHECIQVFLEYGRFPVIFDYNYEDESVLHLPGVTVCNVNPLKRSLLCREKFDKSHDMPKELRQRLCAVEPAFYEPNFEDRNLQEKLVTWMAQLSSSRPELLERLSTRFEDMILSCSYGHKNCKSPRFFRQMFMNRYGNCLCFHCNASSTEEDAFYVYDSTESPQEGLELVLDVQADEYLPTSTEMGFLVMVHGHGFRASACNDGDFVEPGHATYIGIHLDCRHLCLQYMLRERCKCESSDITTAYRGSVEDAYPICESDYENEACVASTRAIMDLQSVEQSCKCHPACAYKEYYKEISKNTLTKFEDMEGIGKSRRIVSKVTVYFHTFTSESVFSVPKYDGNSVLNNFGRINGIYLGVSFFVLFRLLDTVVRGIHLHRDGTFTCCDEPIEDP